MNPRFHALSLNNEFRRSSEHHFFSLTFGRTRELERVDGNNLGRIQKSGVRKTGPVMLTVPRADSAPAGPGAGKGLKHVYVFRINICLSMLITEDGF